MAFSAYSKTETMSNVLFHGLNNEMVKLAALIMDGSYFEIKIELKVLTFL